MQKIKKSTHKGFTLLEVLLVIGAVSVLATVSIVAINPSRQMAQIRDNERNTEMEQIHSALRQYYADNRAYPAAVESMTDATLTEICAQSATDCTGKLDMDQDLTPVYLSLIPSDPLAVSPSTGYFLFKRTDGRVLVYTDQSELVEQIVVNGTVDEIAVTPPVVCPTGYVLVPGNAALYGTSDFCVMKYEAKAVAIASPTVGLTTPTTIFKTIANNTTATTSANGRQVASVASGYPIANISQTTAAIYCNGLGAQLINNAEWMTIARNIEGVGSNWTGGSVGIGGLWRGHTDNDPTTALEASPDDGAGYTGTGQSAPSIERRTHTLSNGQVIWDMSGNVWELTSDTIKGNEKPSRTGEMGVTDSNWREWTDITLYGALTYDLVRPSNTTWNGIQNMGPYYKGLGTDATLYAFRRGEDGNSNESGGIFSMILTDLPSSTDNGTGFRCVIRDAYTFPAWATNFSTSQALTEVWAKTQNALKDLIASNTQTDTVSTFGSLSGTDKWSGGVLAPNGMIYGIPANSSSVLKIDPATDTVSTFGSLGVTTSKWSGGVLASNGMIYGIPRDATSILKINPNTDTVSSFGSLSGKYGGGVLAPNGMIYGIPKDAINVLKIDPSTDTATTFGSLGASVEKWEGGVLASNGMIYAIPQSATTVLKIDPSTDTATTFGSLPAGDWKWSGGVLAPNGMIYAIPLNSTSILKINPNTDTATTFGSLSDWNWHGSILAPNGMIYGIPKDAINVLKIDPSIDTATTFGSLGASVEKWEGGVLASNGSIYGIPDDATSVLKILSPMTLDNNFPMSRFFNKY